MPCKPCENGKWKFGSTGKCQYESKESCEKDNADYYDRHKDVYRFEFTESQMETLHKDGEVLVDVVEDGKKMTLHFIYKQDEVMDIIKESNKFTMKYKNYLKQYGF